VEKFELTTLVQKVFFFYYVPFSVFYFFFLCSFLLNLFSSARDENVEVLKIYLSRLLITKFKHFINH